MTRLADGEQYTKASTKGKRTANERPTERLPLKAKTAGVKLTPAQYRLIEERAKKRGLSMSAWMRSILVQAAKRPPSDGYIRIVEPDGATI